MKCINCDNENKKNTNFCSNCGTKIEQPMQQVKQDTTQKSVIKNISV